MSQKYQKLKELLNTLFQLDQPDLDFGLYRIMHAKNAEITQFLDHDLLPQVKQAFSQYQPADKAEIQKALDLAIEQAHALGADPETLPKVKELRERLANEAVDLNALESEVYDHLYSFFRRYYDEGDFLSKRVYKPGVYAIPYEGEETKFTWANQDQYYIKTSEYLRDYAFRLRPDNDANPMRVHFRLVDAAEGEHGNVKAAEGKERLFVLAPNGDSGHDFIQIVPGENGNAAELQISFEYRPVTLTDWPESEREGKKNPPKQENLRSIAVERILGAQGQDLLPWIAELAKPHTRKDGSQAELSRLQAHLDGYTKRNTFDYFIHKDLGGFLRREIDFYIKNEMMHLDDIESESAPRVEQYLSKIKVVRTIAGKIIDFLAQLEDFQKELWLKKKFVIETSYCISVDRIPEHLYQEVADNDLQRMQWVDLYAIDNIPRTLVDPGYSAPLTIEFLKAHPELLVDTSLFGADFAATILDSIDDMEESTQGVLVHSENLQALNLMGNRYSEQVKTIYIDPPYNTSSSSIPYKNDYKHSSWITMMNDRLAALHRMLRRDGAIFVSIDKAERTGLEHVLDDVFLPGNKIEELIWSMNTNNSQAPNYSTNHEYVLVYAKDKPTAETDKQMFREPKPGYEEVMALVAQINPDYPPVSDVESKLRELYEKHKMEFREEIENEGLEWEDEKGNDPWKGLYNYSHAEYRDLNGMFVAEDDARSVGAAIWIWREDNISMPATKQSPTTKDPNHKNWRFYRPPHPVTGIECPPPKSGWKFAYSSDEDSPEKKSFVALDADRRIVWGQDETKIPQLKRFLNEVETNVGKSVFQDYSDGEKQTSAMFGRSGVFLAPKHADFVARFLQHGGKSDSTFLDCFGGSGSTAHAVIKLNREDRGERKFVTVEVADYFDSVLKPRVQKAAYASTWRAGKPTSHDGLSQCFKVIRLESYEDALNNLEVRRTDVQQNLLVQPESQGGDGFKEQYLLKYMLNVETRGSQSLLNVTAFADPTAYKLRVKRPGTDESREVNVDLLETFNWLVGLRVKHIAAPQSFVADFERDTEGRLRLRGRMSLDANGPWWFRRVEGTTPDGRNVLIVWRKLTGNPEQDNLMLDSWMKDRLKISTRDFEFDLIYVNGDNNLENLRLPDDTWKVRLIEEDFHRLMFDAEGL